MKSIFLVLLGVLFVSSWACAQETYGTIKATTKLRPDGSTSTTITDPDKHTAEETITNAAGKVMQKTTYILGDRDLADSAIFYNAKGQVVYKANYKRDDAGHVLESAFSSADDRYLGKRVFVYGADGVAKEIVDYDANGQVITPAQSASKSSKKRR